MLPEIYAGCAERRNPDMAIFHYTIKIVGRSKGKSVISASAYLNGDVMKNEETGSISYYTSKKEVVYTSLMMCENAPSEWQIVPEENIKRFQKSVRYKRSEDKEAAIKKFKITFQKQRLWNEVLKIEKSADAQLGRSFEFAAILISSWHCFRKTYFCFQGADSEVNLAKIIQTEVTFAKRKLNLLFTKKCKNHSKHVGK